MKRIQPGALVAPIVLSVLIAFAGCGGDKGKEAARSDEATQGFAVTAAPQDTFMNELRTQTEGKFVAAWPSGCEKLHTAVLPSPTVADKNATVKVECMRDGDNTRGCSVSVWRELVSGEKPNAAAVTAYLQRTIEKFDLKITKQAPIARAGMEGVAAFCSSRRTGGSFWIEGYLAGETMLVVMAWTPDQSVFTDPEIRSFFRSVTLLSQE